MPRNLSDNTSSPRSARRARVQAILAERPQSTPRPDEHASVPKWLVEEYQKRHTSRTSSNPKPSVAPSGPDPHAQDTDFVLVDMLDGAHLPTKPKRTTPMDIPVSTNTQSIVSLPPVENQCVPVPESWESLSYGQRKAYRKAHRTRASIGANFSEEIQRTAISPSVTHMFPPSPSRTLPPSRSPSNNYLPDTTSTNSIPITRQLKPPQLPGMSPPSSVSVPPNIPPINARSWKAPPVSIPLGSPPVKRTPLSPIDDRDFHIPMPTDPATPLLAQAGPSPPSTSSVPRAPSTVSQHSNTQFRMGSYNWYDDENDSYAPSGISSSVRTRRYRNPDKLRQTFRPSVWGWRKPAEEDSIMPREAWFYLALIGAITFLMALVVNVSSGFLATAVIPIISSIPKFCMRIAFGPWVEIWLSHYVDVLSLALVRGVCLAVAFLLVLKFSPHYAAGSGIPEMKCVLGGVLMPQMLNWKTLVGKMCGLIFSLASGISIGRLGPFIHMSCITASVVSKLPVFPSLRENTRFQLQALSAAMAAGVGATFGAPIGGTLLAIELMATYYFIHWLPMALYCSIMGYYFIIVFSPVETRSYFSTNVHVNMQVDSSIQLFAYVLLGAFCGAIGALLVHFTKFVFKLRRQYFKNSQPWRTAVMLISFAAIHTLIGESLGGVLGAPQKPMVDALFTDKSAPSERWLPVWRDFFPIEDINSALALLIIMIVKFILTGLSLVMPVPAGTFMPIFEIGALFGRLYGQWWRAMPIFNWVDPRAMAIVGAASVTTGALHTTSIAVVMMELTREAVDILPLTLGVITAYGVSKRLCSDLFSELIRIRKLPYLLGLRERYPWETKQFHEDAAYEVAGSFMRKDFPFVTPHTTRAEIYDMLTKEGKPWITCAVLSDKESRRLWGTISQASLWDIVKEDMSIGPDGKYDEPEYGTFNADEEAALRGLETVDFLHNFNPDVGHPLIDMGPMQVSFHTPFWKIATFIRMLSMSQMWVVMDGVTVGCVSKADVISHSLRLEMKAKRKRRLEMNAEALRRNDERVLAGRVGRGHQRYGSRLSNANLTVANVLASHQRKHKRQGSINNGAAYSVASSLSRTKK